MKNSTVRDGGGCKQKQPKSNQGELEHQEGQIMKNAYLEHEGLSS